MSSDVSASHSLKHDHHEHDHGHNYAQANEAFFNEHVLMQEHSEGSQEAIDRLGAAVRELYDFEEEETSVLDFACGTGMFSRQFAPYTKSIIGIDISQNAVDEYNRRVGNQGLAPDDMQAIRIELKGEEGELDGRKFDVAVCSMAYHHFENVADKTRILSFFLKPGGSLIIGDILKPPSGENFANFKDAKYDHIVAHRSGFNEEDMRKVMYSAGLKDFSFKKAFAARMMGNPVEIFVAKATKPSV